MSWRIFNCFLSSSYRSNGRANPTLHQIRVIRDTLPRGEHEQTSHVRC